MKLMLKAALGVATVALASTSANAAFFTYTFNVTGVGTRIQYDAANPFGREIGLIGAVLSIGVNEITGAGVGVGNDFLTDIVVQNTGQNLVASFRPTTTQSVYFATGSASACVLNTPSTQLPQSSTAFATNCGSLSYMVQAPRGGYAETFTGQINSVSVTRQDTGQAFFSLTGVVPEPSTWALMLAGFGMVGYAMRRKRTVVALA